MGKLFTIIGATGTQGSSVVDAVLQSHDNEWKIRALTRNPSSPASQALQAKGIEVVQANLNDLESVKQAFKDSHAIFAVTDFFVPFATTLSISKASETKRRHYSNIIEAAKGCETLEHFIFSTLPPASKISGGKWKIPHFETKNAAEEAIKADKRLWEKTTFLWVGWYGSNFQFPIFKPTLLETSGKHVFLAPAADDTPISSIGDARINVGKFVLPILQQPEKTLPGKYVNGVVEETTLGKLAQDWSAVNGKEVVYLETSLEAYEKLWPGWGEVEGANLRYFDEFRGKAWGLLQGEGEIVTAEDLGLDVEAMESVRDSARKMIA